MPKTTMRPKNYGKPAPKAWRKFEDVMLVIMIPAIVAMVIGWGFQDEKFVSKILLLINTGLVALIKAIGFMLANGDVYATASQLKKGVVIIQVDQLPNIGEFGVWYFDGNEYYYWDGESFVNKGGDRPDKPPVNP